MDAVRVSGPHHRIRLVPIVLMLAVLGAACVEADGVASSTSSTTSSTTSTIADNPATSQAITPTTPSNPSTILVLGDWGAGTPEMTEIAARMEAYAGSRDVEAILTTGDNFYLSDAERLLEPYRWAREDGIEFWVTWGNHDIESPDRIAAVNEAFDDPPRWRTIRWQAVDLVLLDSNNPSSSEQLAFLEAVMSSTRPGIVVSHHPAFSCSKNGGSEPLRQAWVRKFDGDVTVVLAGHDHNYQRFEVGGTWYVVSGGGGQRIYPIESCPAGHPPLVSAAATFHFLALTQTTRSLDVEAIDIDGTVIDSFSIPLVSG